MKARRIYIIMQSVMAFASYMLFTSAAVYRIEIAKLLPYQLILLGTALEISIIIFETPTGVVADLKSRKLSVIIGLIVMGAGFGLEAVFPFFIPIVIAQIIWGTGYTFISGAIDAWLSDETENRDIEKTMIKGAKYANIFTMLGIFAAMTIGTGDVRFSMLVSASVLMVLGIVFIFVMPENHFKQNKHEGSLLKQFTGQLKNGIKHIKGNSILSILLIITICYGLYSEGIDRLYELFILDNLNLGGLLKLKSIWVIGGVNMMAAILSFFALSLMEKYTEVGKRIIIIIIFLTILMIVGILTFAYSPAAAAALAGFILFRVSREGTYPLLNSIQLRHTPSHLKATVLSAFSQADAIGQVISGVIMASLAAVFGIRSDFLAAAVLLLIAVILLIRLSQKEHS